MISVVSLLDAYFRRCFAAAGLRRHDAAIDADTVVHCWIPHTLPVCGERSVAGATARPVLLLLHGFGPTSPWQWRCQVGPLSKHFDVVVPDLIFFGRSTTLSPRRSEEFQAEAMAKLLAALGVADGRPVNVVGTSYGGFVAYHMARSLGRERVARVVIASSDLLKAEADDRAMLKRARDAAERDADMVNAVGDVMLPQQPEMMGALVRLAFHRRPSFLPRFVLRDAITNLYSDRLEEKVELIKGVTIGKEQFQLTQLPQDVLIIWGEHDQIFPLEKAFEMKRKLGEASNLEIIKNTGHMPQAEDPGRFNQLLFSFLLPRQDQTK